MDQRPLRRAAALVRVSFAVAGAAAVFAAGWFARGLRQEPARVPMSMIRERGPAPWRFINPLLECDEAEGLIDRPELVSFKRELVALVGDRRASDEIMFASIYFRELNDGRWIGVNERTGYVPASLLKLPTLIAVLRRAEGDPGLLAQRLTFSGPRDENEIMAFRPAETLEAGRSYTIEELCRRMVRYSDNNATGLLNQLVTLPEQGETLRGLGVLPELVAARGKLDVKTISAFLRVLYNSSYLDRERSEMALEMLSRSSFREGIISGVPGGVAVCSKYGEAAVGPELKQLHEFAIVYHRSRPYLLGVMTQGRELRSLVRFIADVSRVVYSEVDRQSLPAEEAGHVEMPL
jgi:beta-lactamase class A